MTAVTYRDASPPYLFPAYESTLRRGPGEPLIEAPPEWLGHSAGPDFRRIPVPADGADLLQRHAGEPIGERVVIDGRVLGSDRQPMPGTLVEMWQANAVGVYEDPSDPGFFPARPELRRRGPVLGLVAF